MTQDPASSAHDPGAGGSASWGPQAPTRELPPEPGPASQGRRWRRWIPAAVILLLVVVALIPVPYAILSPGPVLNTLGSVQGKKLIAVAGHPTYPTTGELDLTTVYEQGGPISRVTVWQALRGWLDPTITVLPEDRVFPAGTTRQQQQQQDQAMMTGSQQSATAAALTELGIDYTTALSVRGTVEGSAAAGVLKSGDVLRSIDGVSITGLDQLRAQLQKAGAGAVVQLGVRRGSATTTVAVRTTRSSDGSTVLGVYLAPQYTFPFSVDFQIDKIGGPSAGTMFALGIIDTLTPGPMTGGKHIAGTGEISADGTVGPIGGIQQKMAGARSAGARYFLAPAQDCNEVVGHVPDGLQVVRISTLHQARSSVQAIASGQASGLPTCTG